MSDDKHLFPLPQSDETAVWESEDAASQGWEVVRDPGAHAGAYVEPAGGAGAILTFRFHTDRTACLKLFPLWWRHGDQRAATRFPATLRPFTVQQVGAMAYPDPRGCTELPLAVTQRPGPDAVDRFEGKVFFTAPEAGRVGVVDLASECLVDAVEVGGYLADLLVDAEAGRVFVADAAGDRVVALDARTHQVVAEAPVPAFPCALALAVGRLVVASLEARALTVLDPATLEVTARQDLPVAPQHVAAEGDRVVVRLLPGAFDPVTGEEHAPDRLCYFPLHPFPQGPEAPPLLWQSLRAATGGRFAHLVTRVDNWEEFHVQAPTALVALGPTPTTLTVRWPNREPAEEQVSIEAVVALGGAAPPAPQSWGESGASSPAPQSWGESGAAPPAPQSWGESGAAPQPPNLGGSLVPPPQPPNLGGSLVPPCPGHPLTSPTAPTSQASQSTARPPPTPRRTATAWRRRRSSLRRRPPGAWGSCPCARRPRWAASRSAASSRTWRSSPAR